MSQQNDKRVERLAALFISRPDLVVSNQWIPLIEDFIEQEIAEATRIAFIKGQIYETSDQGRILWLKRELDRTKQERSEDIK